MTTLHAARHTEQTLRSKHADAQTRLDGLLSRRAVIALPASCGNAALATELAELHAAKGLIENELESLNIAILQAQIAVAEAEEAVQAKAKQATAAKALEFAERIRGYNQTLETTLQAFLDELEGLSNDAASLRAIGYGPMADHLFEINLRTALETRLQFTKLRGNNPFLAPSERKDFSTVIDGLIRTVEHQAGKVLGKQKEAA